MKTSSVKVEKNHIARLVTTRNVIASRPGLFLWCSLEEVCLCRPSSMRQVWRIPRIIVMRVPVISTPSIPWSLVVRCPLFIVFIHPNIMTNCDRIKPVTDIINKSWSIWLYLPYVNSRRRRNTVLIITATICRNWTNIPYECWSITLTSSVDWPLPP